MAGLWGDVVLLIQLVATLVFSATGVFVLIFYHLLVLLDQNRIFSQWKNFHRSTGLALLFGYFIVDV